jgi:alpha-L-fucosidase 2
MTRISVSVLSTFAAIVSIADVSASNGESLRHGITTDRPATNWREAPPCGNGTVGAMPYGPPQDETILLNHEALFYPIWYTPKREDVPNMAQYLPELRRMIAKGRYGDADGFWNSKLAKHNYALQRFPFTHPYHPVGDIVIQRQAEGQVKNYQQSLDFEKAEAVASWIQNDTRYERALFVSRADDAVVVRLGSSEKESTNANIALTPHLPQEGILPTEYRGHMILPKDILPMFMGKAKDYLHAKKIYSGDPIEYTNALSDEYYVFHGRYPDGRTFGAVAKVSIDGGRQQVDEASGKIEVVGATEVLVTAKLFANERDTDAVVKRLKDELKELPSDYDKLLDRHVLLHRKLFMAMTLSLDSKAERTLSNSQLQEIAKKDHLPRALVERVFDFGRYALQFGRITRQFAGGMVRNVDSLLVVRLHAQYQCPDGLLACTAEQHAGSNHVVL